MNNQQSFDLNGAGLGEILPSSEGRAMTKDRSNADTEVPDRAPVQYVPKPKPEVPTAAPPADDPFDIFNSVAAAPAPAPAAAAPNVFGFSNQTAQTTTSAQADPFAGFAPNPAPVAPAPAADDPFAGFAPSQPAATSTAAPAANDWGFPDDDFFNFSQSNPTPSSTTEATATSTSDTPDIAALNIKDKPPPLPSEGKILARLSARSLFSKDWVEMFWVFKGYHLYIYRNEDDFKYGKPGENIKKDIVITAKMRCLPIKKKEYGGFGMLHNFFLEEVEDYGANQVAKFASRDLKDVELILNQINRRLRKLKGV